MHSSVRDDCLYLHGWVTAQTVTRPLYKKFVQECSQNHITSINLHGVKRADSVCITLLLTALRHNRQLTFRGLPPSVRTLAELYEIREWIPAWTPDTPALLSYSHSA